jgi:hypothetical protein
MESSLTITEAPASFYAEMEAAAAADRTTATQEAPRTARNAAPDRAAAYLAKVIKNATGKVATAHEGERHATLLAQGKLLGGYVGSGSLTEAEVTAELSHAAKRAGLPEEEIAATIRDGLAYGRAEPLALPEHLTRPSRDGQPEPRAPGAPNEDGDDPHRLCRLFLKSQRHADGLFLRYSLDDFGRWDGPAYHRVPATELRAELTEMTKAEFNRLHRIAQTIWAEEQAQKKEGQDEEKKVPG